MTYSYFLELLRRSGTSVAKRGSELRFTRAAVTSLPFTDSVLPTYLTLSAELGGAPAEPMPHADSIASAIGPPAYFTKRVAFNYGSPFRADSSSPYFSSGRRRSPPLSAIQAE